LLANQAELWAGRKPDRKVVAKACKKIGKNIGMGSGTKVGTGAD